MTLREKVARALFALHYGGDDLLTPFGEHDDPERWLEEADAALLALGISPDAQWRLDQLVPVKEAARTLPRLLGRDEPMVLTRRGEPMAILFPLEKSA